MKFTSYCMLLALFYVLAQSEECVEHPTPLSFRRYYDYWPYPEVRNDTVPDCQTYYSCRKPSNFFQPRCTTSAYHYSLLRLRVMCGGTDQIDGSCVQSLVPGPQIRAEDACYSFRNWTVFVAKFSEYEGDSFEEYADRWVADPDAVTSVRGWAGVRGQEMRLVGDPGMRLVQDENGSFPHACASLVFGFPFSKIMSKKGYGPDRQETQEPMRYVFDLNLPPPVNTSCSTPCAKNDVIIQEVCVPHVTCVDDKPVKICLTFLYTVPVTDNDRRPQVVGTNLSENTRQEIKSQIKALSENKFTIKNFDKPPEKTAMAHERYSREARCYSILYYYAPIVAQVRCRVGDRIYFCNPSEKRKLCNEGSGDSECELVVETLLDSDLGHNPILDDKASLDKKPYMWVMSERHLGITRFSGMFNRREELAANKNEQVFLKVVGGQKNQKSCGRVVHRYYDDDNGEGGHSLSKLEEIGSGISQLELPSRSGHPPLVAYAERFEGRLGILKKGGVSQRLNETSGRMIDTAPYKEERGIMHIVMAYIILEVEEQKGIRLCVNSRLYNCETGQVNETALGSILGKVTNTYLALNFPPSNSLNKTSFVFGEHKATFPDAKYNRTP